MKVSFPNMGMSWPAFKTLFECLGIEVILPDPTNRETIKFGVAQSPEFVCFPFKPTLGDLKNALDKGADTLIMAIDCGPCRFGFYASVQERILRDLGYDNFRLIPLDQADLLEFKWLDTLYEVKPTNKINLYRNAVKAAIFFLKKAKYIEDIQTAEGIFRAYEINQGDTTRTVKKLLKKLDKANTLKELREFKKIIKEDFNKIEIDKKRNPLKVTLTGEIHVTLEPAVNLDIRRKLGELGCEVYQSLSLYDWVVHKFHLNYHRKWLEYLAKPYIPMDIGGECVWVIGEYINSAKEGRDGFVHTYPFTCMPEVTARTIINNKLKKIYDLPAIYFSFDEQSGAEGFRTRLEAFVELMHTRRKDRLEKTKKVDPKVKTYKDLYSISGNNFLNECIQLIETK
ncbi:MAG: acyl-CoA dehydratase activase-related protein [Promethearchaeota archaeon]